FFVFFGFVILFLTFSFPPSITLLGSVIIGLGGTLVSGDISLVAVCILLSATSVVLKEFTKYASALGMILVDTLLALYVGISSFDYFQLIALTVGLILFLCIPRNVVQTLAAALGGLNGGRASRTIVNQNRVELSSKLQNVSRVFWNMSSLLSSSNPTAERYKPDKLAESIACSYCSNCADCESCFSALGTDTRGVLLPMVEASLTRNKVTILDMPPFITSRCSHMQGLVNTINHTGEKAKHELGNLKDTTESRMLISEQFGGVSVVLDTLAKDIKKRVSFSPDREAKITRELARHNIIANEVVVYGECKGCQVTLAVREGDTNKLVLDKLVSAALGIKMERVPQELALDEARKYQTGEWRIVHLQSAPLYNVAFGIAERKRETEEVSGDSKIITNLSDGKMLIALCDGMGSGEGAMNSSATAIALIENFFRAGFESPLVLSLVNRMLALRNSDDYSTLDLVVVDRMTGELDLVKMGASDSFIVHGEEIQVIESGTPPVGILDKISPVTMRITLQDTDMAVLVSDGICDTLSSDGVATVIESTNSLNPQTLADALISAAVTQGAQDDCTAVVFRLVVKP
ncbi:MAG TPA: SpoIIE family protein phosphatase, partial [Clostridia bacterium]|nr:SpoIIE family protein phosphatase [Clostridia bacterium]